MKHAFPGLSELGIIIMTTSILLILFIPIPPGLLDLLLIINFCCALTILLLTFQMEKPLAFSTFPTLLLITTLFRLALNISATRLILSDAHAGDVIQTVGTYVIGGNYVMGLTVFLILIIVQFIVITNGSQRVAEVAARFTLDSMPGKQMSIDADLNAGSITLDEAKNRRAQIEREASFYGAMDGAGKFVKGDAIAGILIILVDIIGGFAIGLLQKGMSFSESIQTYTLLTVGDGLVTQIPALIISTATGIIVTRAATDSKLGHEVMKQISADPKSLIMVCLVLVFLLFTRGIPSFPTITVLIFFGLMTFYALSPKKQENETEKEKNLYELLEIHPIEIRLHPDIFTQLQTQENQLLSAIQTLREKLALTLGFVIPNVILKSESTLHFPCYQIHILGNGQEPHHIYLEKILVLQSQEKSLSMLPKGIDVTDPCYGLPGRWISMDEKLFAESEGFTTCQPIDLLVNHLKEILQNRMSDLLTRTETEKLLDQPSIKTLRDELIPHLLTLSQTQKILQNLLQEKVSIRPLAQIMETLLEHAKQIPDSLMLTEMVRINLGNIICQKLLASDKSLHVLTLEPELEHTLSQQLNKDRLILDPSTTENLLRNLFHQAENMLSKHQRPILLCSALLRRPIRHLTQRIMPHLTILGMNEIPIHIPIASSGTIGNPMIHKQESL